MNDMIPSFHPDFYLWAKALHIVFVSSWFAGLFYLPRIFVNLAQNPPTATTLQNAETQRLLLMARKLFRFMTLLAIPAILLGMYLWIGVGIGRGSASAGNGWMHAKLGMVLLVIGYHHSCFLLLKKFEKGICQRSETWFRWYNEVPVLFFLTIVVLVVVKPF